MRKVLRFCSILCAFSLIAPTVTAGLIPLDISITGNAELDTTYSASTTGNASQSANMSLVIGGGTTLTSIANLTPTGATPLAGTLTDFGDGVGVSAIGSSTAGAISEVPDFFFDIDFSLLNSSATDTYQIFFELAYSVSAHAQGNGTFIDNGSDAFVNSEVNLFDDLAEEIFASDLTSDRRNGDEIGDVLGSTFPGTNGASLSDSGTFLFDITLAAGASNNFSALVRMDGGAFSNDAFFNGRSSAFISILSADNLTAVQPPSQVPEPSTFILFFMAMALLQVKRKINN
ncbi:PEP-CTERM sorting domain-containing protein [Colwellia sp. BRX8-4]|uniref:PEP-CTERM sorting domain-containing protein n=1 Tax=Colwellia sp. BRX8-4 TaxID=2759836 RepID=UPI0015F3D88B|nr:PEP-CTERM sorting domain-containing protein [Colwellia sp. BRX8-4]MBA6363447.1 PEP-CTERM sorting domain-containing protein [Colwellia sp. BRX8-8]MBA6372705.1 PEP-CTERM sorting domain-containing protein [Colwellia sp. BRX8-4]